MNADFSFPNKRYRWLGIALVFCITLISALYQTELVGAVATTPDLTFGMNGTVLTNLAYRTVASDVAIQADGKIVVVGYADTIVQSPQFTVTRYNPDGSLDASFDGDGILTAQFRITGDYTASYGRSLAIQPDGKIVVVGESYIYSNNVGTTDFAVARLNPDGSFDASFDGDGRTTLSPGPGHNQAYDVEIQPGGKIVVSGNTGNGTTTYYPALARLNPNGSLDTTFFGSGTIAYINDLSGSCTDLFLQPDGKINAFVSLFSGGYVFLRYNADGSPDNTFGNGGRLTIQFSSFPLLGAIALQPDGKIIVGGSQVGQSSSQYDFLLVRFYPNGTRDNSFGNNGTVITNFGNYANALADIAAQPDGKIVAVGYATTSADSDAPSDFALARYNADGSLDTTFGTGGKVVTSVGIRTERLLAVAIQPNGKIVAAGTAGLSGSTGSAAVLRFMGDINTADFDGDTKTDVSVFRPSTGAWYLSQSASGFSAVNWGLGSDKLVPGDYTGDGRTDIAVFRPSTGDWFILRSENSSFYSVHFGTAEDQPTQGDFDGDGKTDIAVFRPSTGVWYRINSLGGSVSQIQFGTAEDKPVVGDYDGDGRSDINVFRPSNSTFYRLNSSNGEFSAIQFGTGGDVPVSADFNGDSKTDIAVFRPSNGVWYWLRSSDGGFQAIQWGQNGDVPTAADFDGDGISDVAVFRPASGTWYLNRSQLGFAGIQFGQNGDQLIPNVAVP
jgi:uncharacterized delta-60 repeat protein